MALVNPSYTVDTTFSSKNIATAASVYTFTAAASAKVQFIVKLTNAAGNGDYIVYLKRQWGGAGTASTILPKTTAAAASGETVIEFVTIPMQVKIADVVDVYIDGLAGDTSVNGNIRIVADNPSVFDASADSVSVSSLATDVITAASLSVGAVTEIQAGLSTFDNTTDSVIVSDLTTAALQEFFTTNTGLVYNDAVDGSVVKEVLDGVPPSTLGAGAIWTYSSRTLTQTAAQVADAVNGGTITIQRGDTLTANLTGVGALTDYVSIDFTVKLKKTQADTEAIIRVRKNLSGLNDGLLRLNGAAVVDETQGSITITDLGAGDITITLDPEVTAQLTPQNQQMYYDIQMITASAVQTMATGLCNIAADVTRAIS